MATAPIEHTFKKGHPFNELVFYLKYINAEQAVYPRGGHLPELLRHRQK